MTQHNWPLREEWAYRQQHPYWDYETGCPFVDKYKHRLSDYATEEEIATLIAALKNLWREKGREMRVAKLQAAERGLSERDWYHLPEGEEKEIAIRPGLLQSERKSINALLAKIRHGGISFIRYNSGCEEATELLRPFNERFNAAYEAAEAEWKYECLQIPVDDAAWEKELQRRQKWEDDAADNAAHPERFVHFIG
jgi:hypothetical protein